MINQKIKATLQTRGKGVPQHIVNIELQYDDFQTCLTTGDFKYNDFHPIRRINHKLHTFHWNEINLN